MGTRRRRWQWINGCVQAFTEASHSLDKNDPFKVIYGVEAIW